MYRFMSLSKKIYIYILCEDFGDFGSGMKNFSSNLNETTILAPLVSVRKYLIHEFQKLPGFATAQERRRFTGISTGDGGTDDVSPRYCR